MAPGPGEAASRPPPVADNYLKGEGGEGERGRKIQRRNGTKREGTKAWRSGGKWNRGGEGGGRGQKAKRGVLWLAAKNRREHRSTTGRSVRVCERDRKEGEEEGEGEGEEKKKKREKKKNEEKEGKRKRSTHHHPLGSDETHACDPMAFHTAILSDPSSPRFPSHLLIPAETCSFLSFFSASNDVTY